MSLNTETIRRMFEFLSRSENVVLIPQAFLATATEWVEQTQGLRGFAKLENDYEQRRGLNDGVLMLKAHMWGYLSCGILAEMPATAMSFTPKQESLQRLAAVLPDRYTVLGNAAMAEHFEPGTRLQLAETRGFAMFRRCEGSALRSGRMRCEWSGALAGGTAAAAAARSVLRYRRRDSRAGLRRAQLAPQHAGRASRLGTAAIEVEWIAGSGDHLQRFVRNQVLHGCCLRLENTSVEPMIGVPVVGDPQSAISPRQF